MVCHPKLIFGAKNGGERWIGAAVAASLRDHTFGVPHLRFAPSNHVVRTHLCAVIALLEMACHPKLLSGAKDGGERWIGAAVAASLRDNTFGVPHLRSPGLTASNHVVQIHLKKWW